MTKRVSVNESVAYDQVDDMFKVKSMQQKWRDSFAIPTGLDDKKWEIVQLGTNHVIDTGTVLGEMALTVSTDVDSETIIRSKGAFTVPFRCMVGHNLSQRILGQEFYLEFISIDPLTGEPDGKHMAGWLYDGASATKGKYRVQNSGLQPLVSADSTIITTASYSIAEIELYADESYFHVRAMDSTSARSNSFARHQQIPDPNALYKMQIRAKNISGISNTAWKFQFVNVNDYAELTTEITAGRGIGVAGQGIFSTVAGTVTVAGQGGHDAVLAGYPVRIGARALSAPYTSVASGDVADLISTLRGALVVRPYAVSGAEWCKTGVKVDTSDLVIKTAGASGVKNFCTSFQYQNTHATIGTEIVLKDGATVVWMGYAKPNMESPACIVFSNPCGGSVATAMSLACMTAGANVYFNAQGHQEV